MTAQKQKRNLYPLHTVIGFAIMLLFWVIPPIEPITSSGMRCAGAFLGMVYLWSLVGMLWPSIAGLFILAISGIGGDAGFNGVWMQAVGVYTVLMILFSMILFGAMDEAGDTQYIVKWILTRKIFKGRPLVFMATFFACCFVLGAVLSPLTSLIILWPLGVTLMHSVNVTRDDAIWKYFFVGMFAVSTLGMPLFPFKGAELIPYAAFSSMTAAAGNPMTIPMGPYMLVNFTLTILVMAIYLLFIKYVLRVDMSKFKAIDPATVEAEMPLPPMTLVQKLYLIMIPCYIIMILLPSFFKNNPISNALGTIGVLGVAVVWVLFFLIVRVDGKPMLNFKEVAYRKFDWGIFFMLAAAVYGANTLSNPDTGIPAFLIQALTPLLGGRSEMAFVAIMFTTALILTNFANNAAMAVVLMPVVLNFSNEIGINPMPVATGVILMVFVAMLTPAASPHAGMMHGMKSIYSTRDIMTLGFPICILTLVLYIFVGYPLCKVLMGV